MPSVLHHPEQRWLPNLASPWGTKDRQPSRTTVARQRVLWLCIICSIIVACYTPVVDLLEGHSEDSFTQSGPLSRPPNFLHPTHREIATYVLSGLGLIIAASGETRLPERERQLFDGEVCHD